MVVWALGGGTLLTVQAMGIAYCIAVYHEVTVTNVLYNTRGLWSVALVWVVGHWFANSEKQVGGAIMSAPAHRRVDPAGRGLPQPGLIRGPRCRSDGSSPE